MEERMGNLQSGLEMDVGEVVGEDKKEVWECLEQEKKIVVDIYLGKMI